MKLTDELKKTNERTLTLKMFDEIQKSCSGIGNNPFCVNFITITCHGITADGDSIAVIPE
jgi:hypothetical protein